MDVTPRQPEERTTVTILVTGANSGLGFALCCRLMDEFLFTRPQSQTLHILFSTRDFKKGENTLKRLNVHLQKTLKEANGRTPGVSLLLEARIKLEGVLVDLTRLLSVKALAKDLLSRGQKLDAVVWNAGIAGYRGLNWAQATWTVLTDLVQATTYPTYAICDVGLTANTQLRVTGAPQRGIGQTGSEPKLGQVFLSNVFGHYILTHWLAPLMNAETRIIWISSISALPHTFDIDDIQGLRSSVAYESSKRLTDFLVLTSGLPSTQSFVQGLLPFADVEQRPKMYLTHPGVVQTSIAGLNWFIGLFMALAFYLARAFGSPWHVVDPYKGAVSAAFTCLAPPSQLDELEEREGKGKWGSAVGVYGDERVGRTEVEGWGYSGKQGKVPTGSVTSAAGRYRGHQPTTRERMEQFEVDGQRCWKEMEQLRMQWESRLGNVSALDAEDI